MRKYLFSVAIATLSACVLVAGCDQALPVPAAAASGVAQTQPADHSALYSFMGGALLGHLFTRSSPSVVSVTHPSPNVVHQTIIQKKIVQVAQPVIERPVIQSKPQVTAPVTPPKPVYKGFASVARPATPSRSVSIARGR